MTSGSNLADAAANLQLKLAGPALRPGRLPAACHRRDGCPLKVDVARQVPYGALIEIESQLQ
jgi:hypothetical protein